MSIQPKYLIGGLLFVLIFYQSIVHATVIERSSIQQTVAPVARSNMIMPVEGVKLYQQGLEYIKQNQLDKAEKAFKGCLEIQPIFAPGLLGLAEIAYKNKQSDQAQYYLDKALKAEPENASVQLSVGRFKYLMRDFSASEMAIKKAAQLDPDLFTAYVDLGELYLQVFQKPQLAESAYRKAIAIKPDHGGAYYGLANSLLRQKKYQDAVVYFKKSSKLSPDNYLPFYGLMKTNIAQKQFNEALDNLSKAINLAPGYYDLHLKKGDIYLASGDSAKAIIAYKEAISKKANAATAYMNIGMAFHAQKKYHEAQLAYLDAIKQDEKLAIAYNNLAWMIVEQKLKDNYDQALVWAKKAHQLAPDSPSTLDTLMAVYRARNEQTQAILLLDGMRKNNPSAEILYHLGIIYLDVGDEARAKDALNQALELNGQFTEAGKVKQLLKKL